MQAVFSLTLVFGVLVAITIAGGPPSEEKKKAIDECKVQEKATDEDVQQWISHKMPTGANGNCFIACIYEKNGVIKDGKVVPEALKAFAAKDKPMSDSANECLTVAAPTRCEVAAKLTECFHKAMTKAGGH